MLEYIRTKYTSVSSHVALLNKNHQRRRGYQNIQNSSGNKCTRWFKYDRDYLCVNKPQSVPVIFEPPCTYEWTTILNADNIFRIYDHITQCNYFNLHIQFMSVLYEVLRSQSDHQVKLQL